MDAGMWIWDDATSKCGVYEDRRRDGCDEARQPQTRQRSGISEETRSIWRSPNICVVRAHQALGWVIHIVVRGVSLPICNSCNTNLPVQLTSMILSS